MINKAVDLSVYDWNYHDINLLIVFAEIPSLDLSMWGRKNLDMKSIPT